MLENLLQLSREERHEIYLRAYEELDRRGLARHTYQLYSGEVCIVGAVCLGYDSNFDESWSTRTLTIFSLKKYLENDVGVQHVFDISDDARDKEEVLQILKKAIQNTAPQSSEPEESVEIREFVVA